MTDRCFVSAHLSSVSSPRFLSASCFWSFYSHISYPLFTFLSLLVPHLCFSFLSCLYFRLSSCSLSIILHFHPSPPISISQLTDCIMSPYFLIPILSSYLLFSSSMLLFLFPHPLVFFLSGEHCSWPRLSISQPERFKWNIINNPPYWNLLSAVSLSLFTKRLVTVFPI